MLVRCAVVLIVTARCLRCETSNFTVPDSAVTEAATEEAVAPPADTAEPAPAQDPLEFSTISTQLRSGRGRRNPRRPRGYYNDFRFRNNAYNPYNPNSPFAFRGRPRQLPPADYYNTQYYDPYQQGYYQYPAYSQAGYYGYPYQPPQPQPPPPPTQPPTEKLPDLYYVQAADSPDGHYQYRKVSIAQDNYGDGRSRRFRATRWPAQSYGQVPQGYYNYPYDPYNRRAYPPQPPYYPQSGYYPQQWPQQYPYPRAPRASRSRLRTGKPPFRGVAVSPVWRLTPEPAMTQPQAVAAEESVATEQVTEQSKGV